MKTFQIIYAALNFRHSFLCVAAFFLLVEQMRAEDVAPETYKNAEEALDEAARDLDEFLGGDKATRYETDYHLFAGALMGYDTRNKFLLKPDINLRLVLPRLKRRFVLLFNSSDRTSEGRTFNSSAVRPGQKSDPIGVGLKGVGLAYEAYSSKHYAIVLQEFLRIHFDKWPDPVSRVLLETRHDWGRYTLENRVGPHWDPRREFGSLFAPRLSVRINPKNFLYLNSGFQWWYPDGYFKEESVSLVGIIDRLSAISFETSFEYQIAPYVSKDFIYSIGYRRRLFYRWLTGQFTPALILDGQDNWKLNYRLAIGIQISFGSRYSRISDFLSF